MLLRTTTILRHATWPYSVVTRLEMEWDEGLMLNLGIIDHSEFDWRLLVILLELGSRHSGVIKHQHVCLEKTMEEEKSVTEMSDEELITELNSLRTRRQQARERRAAASEEKTPGKSPVKKGPEEVTGKAGDLLDDILGDL